MAALTTASRTSAIVTSISEMPRSSLNRRISRCARRTGSSLQLAGGIAFLVIGLGRTRCHPLLGCPPAEAGSSGCRAGRAARREDGRRGLRAHGPQTEERRAAGVVGDPSGPPRAHRQPQARRASGPEMQRDRLPTRSPERHVDPADPPRRGEAHRQPARDRSSGLLGPDRDRPPTGEPAVRIPAGCVEREPRRRGATRQPERRMWGGRDDPRSVEPDRRAVGVDEQRPAERSSAEHQRTVGAHAHATVRNASNRAAPGSRATRVIERFQKSSWRE